MMKDGMSHKQEGDFVNAHNSLEQLLVVNRISVIAHIFFASEVKWRIKVSFVRRLMLKKQNGLTSKIKSNKTHPGENRPLVCERTQLRKRIFQKLGIFDRYDHIF